MGLLYCVGKTGGSSEQNIRCIGKIYSQVESLGDLETQILTSGSSPWDLVQTVVDTTTTLTQLFVDVTVLYQLTSTSQAAHQLLKRCCMVFSDCRRRCASRRSPACGTESKSIGNALVRLGMNRIITILVIFVGTGGAQNKVVLV
jgi:hypothetical protein